MLCDTQGNFFTWRALTKEVLQTLQLSEIITAPLTKLSATELAVGVESGDVVVLTHENGLMLTENTRMKRQYAKTICNMAASGNTLISLE